MKTAAVISGKSQGVSISQDLAPKHRTTKERLVDFYGPASRITQTPEEIDWGKPAGEESW